MVGMIKKFGILSFAVSLIVMAASLGQQGRVTAQSTEDFTVSSFEADYYLGRNENKASTLRVVENIVAEFPTIDQNHGILRAIPETYQGHTVSLKVESVLNEDGHAIKFTTYKQSDNLVLKIGDANKYVHGRQTYRITYNLRNVIVFFDDHDEFYWDINGDQWKQPFGAVTARVHIPASISEKLQSRQRCFVGAYEITRENCDIKQDSNNEEQIITISAANLSPVETMTVVLGFDKDTFVVGPEIAAAARRKLMFLIAAVGSVVAPPLITGIWLTKRWRKYGKDPSAKGVIIPEYQPPKGLNALTSSAILNERLENKGVTALIIELAVKKYLHIYEIPKKGLLGKESYELELVKDTADLSGEETQALSMFFKEGLAVGQRVKLSDLKNELYTKFGKLSKSVNAKLFAEGYFMNDPDKTRDSYMKRGVVVIVVAFVVGFISLWTLAIGMGLSGLLIMLFAKTMPARSLKGVEARDYLFGLRDYMRLAESERIKFLQSPEGAEKSSAGIDPNDPKEKIKLFEKLLPYAMLFGLEKDWAKQFKDLYSEPPNWYHGNWSSFNAVYLASSLGGFNSATASSFTAPSNSGSSGFGGGGFSGGGGGGGGGGGW